MIAIVVQLLSHVPLFAIPWIAACQTSLSFTISLSLLKPMFVELVMPSNHFIFCHSLLLLPSILPSIRVFSNESALCIRWPKYWNFSIRSSTEYSELIFFRIDRFDLFVVQGIQESPPTPQFERRKLWYIYIMEYYSAIKKNTFESVLMRWMKLEPIIQSEVSQKEKQQYSILTHIYGI